MANLQACTQHTILFDIMKIFNWKGEVLFNVFSSLHIVILLCVYITMFILYYIILYYIILYYIILYYTMCLYYVYTTMFMLSVSFLVICSVLIGKSFLLSKRNCYLFQLGYMLQNSIFMYLASFLQFLISKKCKSN